MHHHGRGPSADTSDIMAVLLLLVSLKTLLYCCDDQGIALPSYMELGRAGPMY